MMSPFVRAYIEAALWSSTDSDTDESLDKNFGIDDIASDTLEQIVTDCKQFHDEYGHLINGENCKYKGCDVEEYAGHDFWMTRNRHGCGFWDGDWEKKVGEILTCAAQKYKEVNLYVGDDGLIHGD